MTITIAPRQKRLLEYLKTEGMSKTTKEIELALTYNYQVLTRDLRYLTELKLIKRLPGPGHSFKYKFIQWDEELSGTAAEFVKAGVREIRAFINTVTKPDWSPAFAKPEIRSLISQSMLDLNKMIVAISEGEKIEQAYLDRIRDELRQAFRPIEITYSYIGRILATDELWDKQTLGVFFNDMSS